MNLDQIAKHIDPRHDVDLNGLENAELREFIASLTLLSNNDERSLLRYVARNLRRRVLYDLVPAKVLRFPGARDQYDLEGEIVATIAERLGIPEQTVRKSTLPRVIRQLSVNLSLSRSETGTEAIGVLLRRDGSRCSMCGYRFRPADCPVDIDEGVLEDEPYHEAMYDSLKPSSFDVSLRPMEVDHIIPISSFGSNAVSNLRILCSMCNSGKSDYLAYPEPRPASGYRARERLKERSLGRGGDLSLFYAVLERDKCCTVCGQTPRTTELTLAPRDPRKFFLFDNLKTVCYFCDDYQMRWIPRTRSVLNMPEEMLTGPDLTE
jgi:hypothetical protein